MVFSVRVCRVGVSCCCLLLVIGYRHPGRGGGVGRRRRRKGEAAVPLSVAIAGWWLIGEDKGAAVVGRERGQSDERER